MRKDEGYHTCDWVEELKDGLPHDVDHRERFDQSHRIVSNGISRRPSSSPCSRRVVATSRGWTLL